MAEVTTRTVAAWQKAGVLLVEDGNHGEYRPRPTEFAVDGVAFIRAADMESGEVRFDAASKINSKAVARITKGVGQPEDVLFSHKGTVGKLALVPMDAPPFVCSPQTTFWRVTDRTRLNPKYLYYYMQSWTFRRQWEACKAETDMADYVSLTAQRRLEVTIPRIDDQERIVDALGTLDEKLRSNNKLNQTLEAMSQAIYRSWIANFDPVVAKRDGRQPFGMGSEIAALFPAHFQDSDLGPIPAGWRVSTIGKEVSVVGGSTPSTSNAEFWVGGTHAWITPRDMSRQLDPVILDSERHLTDAGLREIGSGLLPAGTVLLSSRAPIGYTGIAGVPLAINQGFIAMRCEGSLGPQFVLRWTQDNMEEILSRAGGTTFAEISKSAFRPIPIIVPNNEVARAIETVVGIWHKQLVHNVKESRTLIGFRDLLLPKLLAGEVRLRDVERVASGAI